MAKGVAASVGAEAVAVEYVSGRTAGLPEPLGSTVNKELELPASPPRNGVGLWETGDELRPVRVGLSPRLEPGASAPRVWRTDRLP